MLGELVFNAADVVALSDAHMIVEILSSWPWVVTDLLHLSLEVLSDLLLFFLKLLSCGPALFKEHVAADIDRVTSLARLGDLILSSVGDAWVRHRVTVVAISRALEVERSVLNDVGSSPLDSLLDHEDVLSLNLEAGNLVTSCVEVSVVARSVLACAHTIRVVLTQVNDWQLPEAGHVCSLKELTLVRGAIAIHRNGEVLLTLVLLGKGKTGADGQLGTDNTISTIVVALPVVVVHGATLSS